VNITEEGIRAYIDAFYTTLEEESGKFFSGDEANKLSHKSLLPAKIICYVSTQFGIGIEYISSNETTVETESGSARVEDLFVQAPNKLKNVGPMINVAASDIEITQLTLADKFPFRLASNEANVTFIDVRFSAEALSWKRDVEYAEIYGDREASKWSIEAAQNKARDEVLSALFFLQQAKNREQSLHDCISNFHQKSVLLLGSYDTEGKQRLTAIGQTIEALGYDPILIEDVPDIGPYDLLQKVTAIGAICKIILIDDSSPSGHLAEVEICRNNRWVTILLHNGGKSASWMTAGASFTSNVILEQDYDYKDPAKPVSDVMKWAEDKIKELEIKLSETYPWRK